MKVEFNNLNPDKFLDELNANGLNPISINHDRKEKEFIAVNVYVEFDDNVDMSKVNAVVSSHNSVPLPQIPTESERLKALEDALLSLM